ncbi:MAG: hypothetical protein LJE84_05540 [Gammaproteobacteria bacterium]|nr:hypothetical protein [Gammaproteobacteria bacterium]
MPAVLAVLFACLCPVPAAVAGQYERAHNPHADRWNAFTDDLFAQHRRRVDGHEVREERSVGGYARHPDFYEEIRYTDVASVRLISRILWERDVEPPLRYQSPLNIHSIEVNVYDKNGRVVRDYSSTYLPDYKGAPTQTLIFLHGGSGKLRAWRTFNASGELIGEMCRGTSANGEGAWLDIDEDELHDVQAKSSEIADSALYRQCFSTVPADVGDYHTDPR